MLLVSPLLDNHYDRVDGICETVPGWKSIILERSWACCRMSWSRRICETVPGWKSILQRSLACCRMSWSRRTWTKYVKPYQDESLSWKNGDWHAAGCPEVGELGQNSETVPGWKYILERRLVWHAAGCPEIGELYEINRQAKMQYKYERSA